MPKRKPKTSTKHPILLNWIDDKGEHHYRSARALLECLDDAGNELSYSNYHNEHFKIAQKIIRIWCKENGVRIGPTQETDERNRHKRQDAKFLRDAEKSAKEWEEVAGNHAARIREDAKKRVKS